MLFKKRSHPASEDAFMSFHFWLTLEEIEQLEAIARDHQTDPAAVVQKIVKKHWNTGASWKLRKKKKKPWKNRAKTEERNPFLRLAFNRVQ